MLIDIEKSKSNNFEVIKTICAGRKLTFKTFIANDGTCDLEALVFSLENDYIIKRRNNQ